MFTHIYESIDIDVYTGEGLDGGPQEQQSIDRKITFQELPSERFALCHC